MNTKITIVKSNRSSVFKVSEFEKSAKKVLESQVKPQVKLALTGKLKKDILKCNNPV